MKQRISIANHSGVYTLKAEQDLPISLADAWNFFSAPENLSKITPQEMGFNITSENVGEMFAGQIITYKIQIFPFIKSNWITEITQVKHQAYFIDEQRFGPYKMWHHEHHFFPKENGVKMVDRVTYKIPFGFLGKIVHTLFIKRKLQHIFNFRGKILEEKFSVTNN